MSDSNNNDFLKGFSAIDDDDRISPEEPSDGRVEPSLSDDLFKNSKRIQIQMNPLMRAEFLLLIQVAMLK